MSHPDSDLSDGELLRRYIKGRAPDAFAGLVRRHAGFVYSVASRQMHDRHLAEDVTQTVFLLLVRKAPSLQDHEELCGWLFNATMFESRNLLKLRGREAKRIERAGRERSTREDTMQSPPWADVEPYLNEALEGLNEGERQAVMMRYLRCDSYERVGATLGISPAAARQRVHRGLERMREFLAQRGVAASVGGLATGMKLNGVLAPPADLVANTVQAAGQLSASLAGTKGALIMASIKTKAVAGALILGSLGMVAGTAAVIARHRRTTQKVYIDPAPGDARAATSTPPRGSPSPATGGVRAPFQLINAASYDDHLGTKTVGGFVGYINKGDWLRFNKVDLGPPGARGTTFTAIVASPDKYAGNTIEVRQDSLDGPLLATLTVKSTGGHGTWHAQSVPTSTYTGGVHDLFLRFSGGGWNLDKFKFALSARPGLGAIDATSFSEAKGVHVRGGVVCEVADGHWVRYKGLDFGGAGVNAIAITYACENARAGGTIALRLDRLDGPPVAQLQVEGTGSYGRFVTRIIPLDAITGSHDVVLSFSGKWQGIANVSRIEFHQQMENPGHPLGPAASSATE